MTVTAADANTDQTTGTRRINAYLWTTVDGVVESPEQWSFAYASDQVGAAIGATFATSDALLVGRRLYEQWAGYWPEQTGPSPRP